MKISLKFDVFGYHLGGIKLDIEQPAPYVVGTIYDGLIKTEVIHAKHALVDRAVKWAKKMVK